MEFDLQSLFGLLQLYSLAETLQLPLLPPQLGSYTRTLLVSQVRRHLTSLCNPLLLIDWLPMSDQSPMHRIVWCYDISFIRYYRNSLSLEGPTMLIKHCKTEYFSRENPQVSSSSYCRIFGWTCRGVVAEPGNSWPPPPPSVSQCRATTADRGLW